MHKAGRILCIMLASLAGVAGACGTARALDPPVGPHLYAPYPAISDPVADPSAEHARPIGFGSVASGGSVFALSVAAEPYSGPVDAYLGAIVWDTVFFFTKDGGVQELSLGIVPWKQGVTDVSGDALSYMPASSLPTADYTAFLLVTPAGAPAGSLFENYHGWISTLSVFRIRDVEASALRLFGTQAEAGVAILYAMDKNERLSDVARAIMAGTLSAYGDILAPARTRPPAGILCPHPEPAETRDAARPGGYECPHPENPELCRQEFVNEIEAFIDSGRARESLETIILSLANVGYSAEQIQDALLDYLLDQTDIDFSNWYIRDCSVDPCRNIRPAKIPPAVFVDITGTIADSDFATATRADFNVRIRLEGYSMYTGAEPDTAIMSGSVPSTFSGYLLGTPDAFYNTDSGVYVPSILDMTIHNFVGAQTVLFGKALTVSLQSYSLVSPPVENPSYEIVGKRHVWAKAVPLAGITTRDGRPALLYQAAGYDVCDCVSLVRFTDRSGTEFRDFWCDDQSVIQIWIY